MSEASNPFDHSELSPEDLEVLRAFHATETFAVFQGDDKGEGHEGGVLQDESEGAEREGEGYQPYMVGAGLAPALESFSLESGALESFSLQSPALGGLSDAEDEMLVIFASEVSEDIAALRRALEQAERDERSDSPGFLTLQRVAHKIRGTAAAIGCDAMSAIAHYIEIIIQHIKNGEVILLSGLFALGNAIGALEMTLHSVIALGQENMQPLLDLEQYYAALDIRAKAGEVPASAGAAPASAGEDAIYRVPTKRDTAMEEAIFQGGYTVDRQHLSQLIQHAEQLVEQQTALEQARKQVGTALLELHAAQARLRRVEMFFSTLPMSMPGMNHRYVEYDEHPASSLIARILREATMRTGHVHQAKAPIHLANDADEIYRVPTARRREKARAVPPQPLPPPPPLLTEAAQWDEMELDRFTETNLLAHALNEAIADVSTATAELQHALAQLDTLVKQHVAKAQLVCAGTLLLRTAPFSTLSQRAQKAVQKAAWEREVQFEVTGETVEIDQDILETLATPLLQLIKAHLVEAIGSEQEQPGPCQIRLHAHTIGGETIIEFGFSLPIPGGFLDMLQEVIQPLHGSIAAQRNATGGMDFRLRFPHAKGVAQGLLIRAGEQSVIVPFSQVQRIDYQEQETYDQYYALDTLLGFAHMPASSKDAINRVPTSSVLILQTDTPSMQRVAVQVDAVVGQIELVMKPPAAQLRRPGITGMAIDSAQNVLLVLDVPELIRQSRFRRRFEQEGDEQVPLFHYPERSKPKILIADDSVSIRRSLRQTLSQKDYIILEARDGLEALELLEEESPDLLLLDLEMPNMNGYDVLNILRTRAMLPHLKLVLLTSRTSEKHKRRARELGVHSYLNKPCPDDELLDTVASLLQS